MARIFSETYGIDKSVFERSGRSVVFPDLKQVCMACAEERAFLITGKRKVRM
jgi:hypothetical protein